MAASLKGLRMGHEKFRIRPYLSIWKAIIHVLVIGEFAVLSVFAGSSPAAQPPPALELLKQLNSVVLDPTQVYAIRDTHLKRGGMDVYLNRGFIALMTPVQGDVTGAIFWG